MEETLSSLRGQNVDIGLLVTPIKNDTSFMSDTKMLYHFA